MKSILAAGNSAHILIYTLLLVPSRGVCFLYSKSLKRLLCRAFITLRGPLGQGTGVLQSLPSNNKLLSVITPRTFHNSLEYIFSFSAIYNLAKKKKIQGEYYVAPIYRWEK